MKSNKICISLFIVIFSLFINIEAMGHRVLCINKQGKANIEKADLVKGYCIKTQHCNKEKAKQSNVQKNKDCTDISLDNTYSLKETPYYSFQVEYVSSLVLQYNIQEDLFCSVQYKTDEKYCNVFHLYKGKINNLTSVFLC